MDEIRDTKMSILGEVANRLSALSEEASLEKVALIQQNLLEFANFMESQLALIYTERNNEIPTEKVIRHCLEIRKGIVLPAISESKHTLQLLRINDYDKDLIKRRSGLLEPDSKRCKKVNVDQLDIAVIPGLAFDEKGGRLGFGDGFYNRLITKLPETTRKIAIAYEEQVIDHVQMESRKHNIDIIITDQRVIYKI